MRIWRDIPRFSTMSTNLSAGALNNDKVRELNARISAYHGVNKQIFGNLNHRRNQLHNIVRYISKHWPERSAQRAALSHAMGFSSTTEADRVTLRKFARRAMAKANYINILLTYYAGNRQELDDPSDLWRRILAPHHMTRTQVGITPENRLELMDPLHRDFDLMVDALPAHQHAMDHDDLDEGALHERFAGAGTAHSALVVDWIQGTARGEIHAPLWVWLEGTEMCLQPLEAKTVRTTKYVNVDTNNNDWDEVFWLRHNEGTGRLDQSPLIGTAFAWQRFDTQWVHGRLSHKGGRNHTLAYIWNRNRDIFAYPHLTMPVGMERHLEDPLKQDFHHSSFNSGQDVRCAGMIGAREGFVTYLDNDSGHYRPSPGHLARLVRYLQRRNLFADDALVRVANGAGAVPVDRFLNANGEVSVVALLGDAPAPPPPMAPPVN